MPELAEAGYSSLWLPPPTKGSGALSVGYDLWDPFDLGGREQRGTFQTRYGTESELHRLIEMAHRFGIRVYFDNIMNHRAFDVPGYNEHAPEDLYPGMRPEDFHIRRTSDGLYRKWDNVREWWSEWQVQNLGLADLIDIAAEPGITNRNFGEWEGATAEKIKFLRHPDNPEFYCYDANGSYVGFGKDNGLTVEYLAQHEAFYSEYVELYLNRAARWLLDRTKADGLRLDAVKHIPADFFGATFGADRDRSNYGYLGQAQEQFNLTRGFSDWDNHRDTVFDTERPRDDAMMFGEHLGSPPAVEDYINAGMRLLDNDLRHHLNSQLGNPWGTLAGMDESGSHGFATGSSVMHAQSHDSDFAARRELQHAFYLTRGGIGIIYSDGNHKAGLLKGSGGAFPRHANTNFLGQFGDNRIPNLLYFHEHFVRGYQVGRWSDGDVVVYERVDKRDNPGMSDSAGTVGLIMINDNYSSGQARVFNTGFFADAGTDNDAYLYNYSSYGGGFYQYASNLSQVVIPAGGYFLFSWRSPEPSDLWESVGGHPLSILQDGLEVETISVRRTDGADGDPAFNPYGVSDANQTDFSYLWKVPRVTNGKNLKFVVRADGSAENILLNIDGGLDVNGNGRRDNPPALASDVYLGFEQMDFVGRQGPEKFAAGDISRNMIGSVGAETYWWSADNGSFFTVKGGSGADSYENYTAHWAYHAPDQNNDQGEKQFKVTGNSATVWVKVGYSLEVNQARLYHVSDGSNPEGAGGSGIGATQVTSFAFSHSDVQEPTVDWWKASVPLPDSGIFKYKIGVYRNELNGASLASVFPKNESSVVLKKKMLTTFEVDGFDAEAIEYYPHRDYGEKVTGLKEGFHFVKGRAFLSRLGEASIYNTFSRTIYYDSKRPEGSVTFPGVDGEELFGSEYGFVVRSDSSVTEVLFHIDDNDPTNDDGQTGAFNGNGETGDGNSSAWAHAEEMTSRQDLDASHPKEWRFSYRNVPSGGEDATVRIALREASSSTDLTLGEEDGHFRILERKVKTSGPSHRLFLTWPQRDGDKVGKDYIIKTYLSSELVNGRSDADIIANLTVSIDASMIQEAPHASAAVQDISSAWVERNVVPGLAALAYKLPILRNPVGAPDDFRQTIIVDYKDAEAGVDLRTIRTVVTDFVSHGAVKPILTVNGVSADYTTTNLFLDEVKGEKETLEVILEVPHVKVAEVYTNLNNRDLATVDSNKDGIEDGIQPPGRDSVSLVNNNGYYQVHTMTFDSNRGDAGAWVCQLNARKTGAYRLSARFKLENDADVWHWYTSDGRRDHAVVVTPKKVRGAVMYELNPLTVDATGDTFESRSTFDDLHDENRWNLQYLKGIGANWLWFQPIHPRGVDGRENINGQPYDPGSPYAVKNFFEVMPQLSRANNRPAAMQAFKDFVTAADAEGISVMVDAPFNHVAWDAELDEEGVAIFDTGLPEDEIRKILPGFFSRKDDYGFPARDENEIATAPDRDDFGKWEDVKDVYFGNYSALVQGNDPAERNSHQNEEDAFDYAGEGWNDLTRRTWRYFASYVPYWLEKTGLPPGQPLSVQAQTGIDGLRADFGQGLPPQLWEYVINVARSRKWSFVFMSEALDGGAVTYRSSRHFDVLNENIAFALKSSSKPSDYHAAFENRRTVYGDSLVLLNNVSHDEENLHDPWQAFIRYAVSSTNDGVPMLFMGQELGISRTYGFSHYETNFGKQVPHFKRYNSMQPIWDNADFGLDQLYNAYASIGRARSSSPALSSPNRYFLNDLSTNAPHGKIHATAKWEKSVSSPSTSDLLLTFVNLERDNQQAGTFDLSPGGDDTLFGLEKDHLYNVSNLAAFQVESKDSFLWTQARSGHDLLENGIFVLLNPVPSDPEGWANTPYEAQFLKVHDLSVSLLEMNATTGGSMKGAGSYSYGSHANIEATAEPGYAFDGWLGAGVVTPSATHTTISMTEPRSVTATFRFTGDPGNMPTISEFMASNDKTLFSASGDSDDWIEIHNPSTNSIDLSDWYLTNDPANPAMWRFPVGTILEGNDRLVVFASGLGPAANASAVSTRASDLLAHWTFDEGSGTRTADQSGNNHDISSIGGATWTDGKFGKAFFYEGGSTALPLAAHPPASGTEFSISFWSYGDPVELPGKNTSIIESGGLSGRILNIHFPWSNGNVYWDVGDGGSDRINTAIDDSYLLGKWSHWVFVHNRTTGNQKFYLNGSEEISASGRTRQLGTVNRWYLGSNLNGNSSYWYGKVDDLRVYGVELSSSDVKSIYRENPWRTHTTFKLDASGGYLALMKSDATVGKIVNYSKQVEDYSYGIPSNKVLPSDSYLKSATPGKENEEGFLGFVADTKFNVDRGFFVSPFTLSITTATSGATIRYTTDGSTPSASNGNVYTTPFPITTTTIVRAIATKPDYVATDVDTQSYFFPEDVIRQSADGFTPIGWPATGAVNSQKMVYGMDPDIVDGFNTPEEVKEALFALPTLSIATELDNLFGQSNGIYVNARNDGRSWERPMSLELIHPKGSKGFQINAGMRIRGGYSRSANNPKHSFRIFFRSEYGQGNLHYPMFEDEGVEEFDKFDLRTSQNYSWAFGGPAHNTMVREVWSRDTQSAMGQPYTRSRYYHLYLNGVYWGIYMTQERVSGTLCESYLGGEKSDYDTVHQDSSRQINATGGNLEAYDRLWQRTIDGWTDNDDYFQAQGLGVDGKARNPDFENLLNVDNLIDYMLIVYYNGDRDGPASRYTTPRVNNYYAFYNRANPDGWKFPAHDMEHSLGRGENNMVTPLASDHQDRDEKKYFTAHFLHEQLTSNQEYVIRFADRFYLRHFNDGVLSEENSKARIAFRSSQIDKAIIAESARWGDTKSGIPKNRNDWVNNVKMVTDWMVGRNAVVLNQLRTTRINANSSFWYPSIDPPGFSQHGGQVSSSFRLSMSDSNLAPVTIHYTLDESDPRLVGGTISPVAQVAQASGMQNTLLLDAGAPSKAFVPMNNSFGSAWTQPGFNDSSWHSGTSGVGYDTATTYRSLFGIDVLSAMRNKNTSVYFRVPFTATNSTAFTNLTLKIKYDDGFIAYLNGAKVASAGAPSNPAWNGKATSSHSDSAAQQYVSFDLTPHLGHLREGANILAFHGLNISMDSSDMLIVPRLEASRIVGGSEIALPDYLTTVKARSRSTSGEWSALHEASFQVDVVPASVDNLLISEIMYNPAGTGGSEYVEVRNVGAFRIDLTGVTLGGAFNDFTFGSLSLAPGESAVVVQDIAGFNARYLDPVSPYYSPSIVVAGQWPEGKLNNAGETITLTDGKGAGILTFKYDDGGNWPSRTDGRGSSLILPDPNVLVGMTLDERNVYLADGENWKSSEGFHGNPGAVEATITGVPIVIISEILAHTDPPLLDAIELHNPSSQVVDLSGWRLTESASSLQGFRIPDGTVIPSGGYLVFDETDFNPNGLWNPNAGARGSDEFALSGARGGDVWLLEADGAGNLLAFVDHVEFGASSNGVSFGRWPNGSGRKLYPMKERSLFDEASATYPPQKLGGPNPGAMRGQIMISEIMYNPPGGNVDLEFVELYNSGDSSVSLSGWNLDKGVDFTFSPGTLLKPGKSIVVVGFDLNATEKLTAFRLAYGIGPEVLLVGGWKGNLNNGGETICLLRPDAPPADDPTFTPMLIEETVTYSNLSPWPSQADGNGASLVRSKQDSWSDDIQSWGISTGTPSPGPSPSLNNPPTFTSPPPIAKIAVGSMFSHRFVATDPDGNTLSFSSPSTPFWLNFRDDVNGSAVLFGNPPPYVLGAHTVVIKVSDGIANPIEKIFVLTVEDNTPPILTLRGAANLFHEAGTPYVDLGVIAADAVDGDLSPKVMVVNPVNISNPGTYFVSYSVSDQAGNEALGLSRTVVVADTKPPVFDLLGGVVLSHEGATPFTDPGAYAFDVLDGNLTANITVNGTVDVNVTGNYQLTYEVIDNANNSATSIIRTVVVVDNTPPVLTLVGSPSVQLLLGSIFIDPGTVAIDALDGNLTNDVVVSGGIDINVPGTYSLHYSVNDASGNSSQRVSRTITVVGIPPPVITLLGGTTVVLDEGEAYAELGFFAEDSLDGNLTAAVVIGGDTVDANRPGSYFVTYDVLNSKAVGATQAIRKVIVHDVTAPVLTLLGSETIFHEAVTSFSDPGAIANDVTDGNLTNSITVGGDFVDSDRLGLYVITYDVSDKAGNTAASLTRTVTVRDDSAPVVSLLGESNATHEAGTPYHDLGATAFDAFNGDLSGAIKVSGDVNADEPGLYLQTYSVSDMVGNVGQVVRAVNVVDTMPPVLTLLGELNATFEAGLGLGLLYSSAVAQDVLDGNLTDLIIVSGNVNDHVQGDYVIGYSVSDKAGNPSRVRERIVRIRDTLPPVLSLFGGREITIEPGSLWIEPGVGAFDLADGNLSGKVLVVGEVNVNSIGGYELNYSVSDKAGNAASTLTRIVNVRSSASPVITLLGPDTVSLDQGTAFVDPGVIAHDSFDGNLTHLIRTYDNLDVNVPGIHHIAYLVTNASGLSSKEVVRTIIVNDLNDAPTTNGVEAFLSPIREDIGSGVGNPGDTVSSLVEGITDLDSNAVPGFALVATDDFNGTWQYSLDGGKSYFSAGKVTQANALLLRADDPKTLLRFVPRSEFFGTASLTFRAWDQTVGANGERFTIVETGGHSAFSSDVALAVIKVEPSEDSPVFTTEPVLRGKALSNYSYTVTVIHPDGEDFSLHAVALPQWLSFELKADGSATLAGMPSVGNVGAHAVILKATDASGKFSEQSFAIAVSSGRVFDLESGWNGLDWFGQFYVSSKTWIYHPEHGWLFPGEKAGSNDYGIWFWSESLGWHWTREDVYPHLYIRRRQRSDLDIFRTDELFTAFGWFFYQRESHQPRLFFDYKINDWIADSHFAPVLVNANINDSRGGIVSGAGSHGHGDEVTLVAEPNPGYKFLNWRGAIQGESPTITFIITRNISLTANFEKLSDEEILKGVFD